ncbi:hypothetical protein SVAN01_00378 [Stagonosporopsis vannaccii]|nr:hypothetical protein SVAN01_00378 [Stagonosporopsis vannaccii]
MSSSSSHLSGKDAHLYGAKNSSRSKRKEISSSSTVAFSSTLSNLIKASSAADGSKPTSAARARPQKDDIFKTHNKNVKKRALADLDDTNLATQKHRGRTADEKDEDAAHWKRTQRRMEEKARLYAALKRGDVEDIDDKYGVDFDQKWADAQAAGAGNASSSSDDGSDDEQEQVTYVDEFGRTRTGTRADAAREERRKRTLAHDAPDRFTARPAMPEQLIYGDAVQTNAFNPDETIAQQMADLAAKRDKELTPPPELHFDGRAEARTRGTGFMYFDQDEEERRKQMGRLEKEREETERVRRERKDRLEERREMIREKKRAMAEKRSKGKAERFLDELGVELGIGGAGGTGSAEDEIKSVEKVGEAEAETEAEPAAKV